MSKRRQPHFPTRPLRQPEGLNYQELFALTLDTWLIILSYVTVPGLWRNVWNYSAITCSLQRSFLKIPLNVFYFHFSTHLSAWHTLRLHTVSVCGNKTSLFVTICLYSTSSNITICFRKLIFYSCIQKVHFYFTGISQKFTFYSYVQGGREVTVHRPIRYHKLIWITYVRTWWSLIKPFPAERSHHLGHGLSRALSLVHPTHLPPSAPSIE
jgi:hypothetical protein